MTLTEKMNIFLLQMESEGRNVSEGTNTQILIKYYESLGMTQDENVAQWITKCAAREYPAYPSITRAIRKCRELVPRWRKSETQVEEEIQNTRDEVGY